ncbi:MAG: DDE-type integrase/transposase/recombinase [Mucilaginibacter sp.]
MRQLCRLLGYTPQAYYSYGKQLVKGGLKEDLLLQQVVIYRSRQPQLGGRKLLVKLSAFMQAHHISIGRDAFFELLRANRLLLRRRRRSKPLTTMSHHRYKKYSDLVKGYIPDRPCALWVSDITYVPTGRGFAYLSLVTDAYSRKIVGYHLAEGLQAEGRWPP